MNNMYEILNKFNTVLGRSQLNEGKKPDFLDLDKDGDKKEPMKKAAKEKKVSENIDSLVSENDDWSVDINKPVPNTPQFSISRYANDPVLQDYRPSAQLQALIKHYGDDAKLADLVKRFTLPAERDREFQRMKNLVNYYKQRGSASMASVDAAAQAKEKAQQQQAQTLDTAKKGISGMYEGTIDLFPNRPKVKPANPVQYVKDEIEIACGRNGCAPGELDRNVLAGIAQTSGLNIKDVIRIRNMMDPVMQRDMSEASADMTPKQKKFAALAEPKDKITFADKIAGAKKEVDEMLGDVAAKAMREAVRGQQEEVEEGWDDMIKAVKNRDHTKVGDKWKTSKGEVEKTATGVVHRRAYDPKTGETDTGDDSPAAGEKRGRGRPKGSGKSIGAKGPSGKSKLLRKEDAVQESDEIANAKALLKKAGYTVTKDEKEDLDEKAVSKKQQRFMGMVHAAQKGEKPASKEVAKVAKSMGKKDAEDFAATKHKGLPEKKKKKEVEETTTAGSVATAPSTKASSMFGKGVYEAKIAESFDNKLKTVLTEGMSVNMNVDADGKKSLTVTATDDDAVALSKLLSLAGIDGAADGAGMAQPMSTVSEPCDTCGTEPCGCDHVDEALANSPDAQYSDVDTMINKLSGGLNGRKSTGQTTIPVVNRDPRRGSVGPVAEATEQRLWEIYSRYQSK